MEHRDEKLVIEPIIYDNQDDDITPDRLSTRNTRQSSFVPNGTSFIIQGTEVSLTVVNSLPVQAPPSLSRAYEILDELHTSSSRVETSILSPPARVSPVDISPTFPSSQLRIPLWLYLCYNGTPRSDARYDFRKPLSHPSPTLFVYFQYININNSIRSSRYIYIFLKFSSAPRSNSTRFGHSARESA